MKPYVNPNLTKEEKQAWGEFSVLLDSLQDTLHRMVMLQGKFIQAKMMLSKCYGSTILPTPKNNRTPKVSKPTPKTTLSRDNKRKKLSIRGRRRKLIEEAAARLQTSQSEINFN